MTKKQYEEKRRQLMNEAQQLINAGDTEAAQKKMDEVTALDGQWDAIAQAQANFRALNQEPEPLFMPWMGNGQGDMANMTGGMENFQASGEMHINQEDMYDSTDYRRSFMNYVLKGTPIPERYNAARPTKTTDVGAVISPTVINRIVEKMEASGMILPLEFAIGHHLKTASMVVNPAVFINAGKHTAHSSHFHAVCPIRRRTQRNSLFRLRPVDRAQQSRQPFGRDDPGQNGKALRIDVKISAVRISHTSHFSEL